MDGNGKIDSYEFICAMTMLSHSTLEVGDISVTDNGLGESRAAV